MRRSFILGILLLSLSCLTVQAQTSQWGGVESMRGFGQAVEVSGESIFVGEPANVHQSGLVYVYHRADTGWGKQAQLKAEDGSVGDGFGSALSARGERLLIGAPDSRDERGAAYLFEQSDQGMWSQKTAMSINDTTMQGFGSSVALHKDLAFVGAPGEKGGIGAVYVFGRSDDGSWSRKARFANPDTSKGFGFGAALAAGQSKLVVGAPQKKSGAAYVYSEKSGGSWSRDTTLVSDRIDENANYGSTIAVRGGQILVGAPRQSAGTGAVFVFRQHSADQSWKAAGQLLPFDGGPRYRFGSSIAFSDTDVMIGAPGAADGHGKLYQFTGTDQEGQWTSVKTVEGPKRETSSRFAGRLAVGNGVAVAGLAGADYGAGKAAVLEMNAESGQWTAKTTLIGEGSSVLQPITGNKVRCNGGNAAQFGCRNVDLMSFLPIDKLGGSRGIQVNDIWGWKDPETGKKYAIVGRMDGTAFVDISDPTNPVYVGSLPMTDGARVNVWRDIKVYKNYAYVVADNAGEHGMQIFDLTDLREFEGEPLELEEAAHYSRVHSAHNVVINTNTGYAYIVGSSGGGKTCGGGLHMVNIQDPLNPTFEGCFADPSTGRSGTGYTHDAQCVTYHGPDKQYKGDEICFGANETAISIANVTDKKNPKAISTASYPDHAYVHQGWLTENHKYFYQNDELDELAGNVDRTRTLVWDVTDLDDPQLVKQYYFDNKSSDHNLYIKGDKAYESNYVSGLQILDVSNPANPTKVGSFDTQPYTEDEAGFAGTWSNYPFFDSDIIIMTSMQEGLFILQKQPDKKQNL